MLIYDLEIKKAILSRNEQPLEGIEYCEGWDDHLGMGVSSVTAYTFEDDQYHVFMDDNKHEFIRLIDQQLLSGEWLIGFNSYRFDNPVLHVNEWLPDTHEEDYKTIQYLTYDILQEIWMAVTRSVGYVENFDYKVHAGYGLDATCKANGIGRKSGNGAFAPVDFQKGRYGTLLNYNLHDVWMTKNLLKTIVIGDGAIATAKGPIVIRQHPIFEEVRKYL